MCGTFEVFDVQNASGGGVCMNLDYTLEIIKDSVDAD
jgi:hypothetical protein